MANSDFEIIENNYESQEKYGFCYGAEDYVITKDDLQALLDGKCLAATVNGGEYSIFISMSEG